MEVIGPLADFTSAWNEPRQSIPAGRGRNDAKLMTVPSSTVLSGNLISFRTSPVLRASGDLTFSRRYSRANTGAGGCVPSHFIR